MVKSGKHLKPGDTLVVVGRWQGSNPKPALVTVEKVGRKWITMRSGYRARVDNLEDAGQSHTFYLSMEEYRQERDLEIAWNRLRSRVSQSYTAPLGMTQERIEQVVRLIWPA